MNQTKTEERIKELDKKINQLEARKGLMENRMKERERKERTRRLIQVGAIFEKYFDIEGVDEAEKIALALSHTVEKSKNGILKKDLKEIQEIVESLRKKDIPNL